jgi:predicted GNAT family acetyltransferase
MKSYSQFLEDVSQALSTIEKNYQRRYPGMKLSFSHSPRFNTIRVDNIRVPNEQQGQGIGSRVMKGISNVAKRNNASVTLTPEPDKGKKAQLNKFYKKHGFSKNKDQSISDTMIKYPG